MKAKRKTEFELGDKVMYYCPGSEDHGCEGEVSWIGDLGFEVSWDDNTQIDYKWSSIYPGSSIRRR